MTGISLCFLLLYTVGLQALTITYNPEETCAMKGSTVVLKCSYPPTHQYFRRGHWYKHDSRTSALVAGRYVFSSAFQDCFLKLDTLTSSHSGFYEHRVETSYYPMSMSTNVETGPGRANLTVVDTLRKDCWGVSYGSVTDICLLEGSTLDIPCSYGFPRGHTVATAFWYRREKKKDPIDLRDIEQYEGRVEYLGADDIHNCTVRIRDLGLNDSWQYHFRYTTDKPGGAFSGGPVNILVTDLQVSMSSDTVTEGDNLTMSCSTRCKLKGNTTFIWYKDNMTPIKTSFSHPSTSSSLHLDPVSSEDAGQYYCAIEGQEGVMSSAATLHVRYTPRHITAIASPPGGHNENNTVTLTCISDANPPVHTYTWYRKDGGNITLLGVGQTHVVVSNSSEISGFYYCVAQNDIGWKISELLSLPTSDSQQGSGRNAAAAITVVVAFVLVIGFLWLRKKTYCALLQKGTMSISQQADSHPGHHGNHVDDLSSKGLATTSNLSSQRQIPTVPEGGANGDVHYASIRFRDWKGEAVEGPYANPQLSTTHTHTKEVQEDVEYSSVKFCKPMEARKQREDDPPIYSTVQKKNRR